MAKYLPCDSIRLKLWRRPIYQTLSKATVRSSICTYMSKAISNATVWGAPDLFKALAILADTSVRRSAVDRKDLKSCWESEKQFCNHKKKTNRVAAFNRRPFANTLECMDHQWDLPTIWKTRFFRHTLKSSTRMYKNSGSQFLRTNTGITNLELCSFRLVLEGKTSKKISKSTRLEFLEKLLANRFALSDAEDNTSGPLNRGVIADLP